MFVWFATFAVLVVVAVFDSPAMDYRYVIIGSVLPVVELALGHPFVLHTLLGSVAAFVAVVLVTRGRRVAARRLVGLPIGMFLHLVADGTWTRAELFWWPFLGGDSFGHGQVPETAHLGLSLALEVVGCAALVWIVRRFALVDKPARTRFVRTGRLDISQHGRVC